MSNDTPLAFVIEDDSRLADIFAETIKMADYETEIINDGRRALERLAEKAPELIVLDLHLPQVNGAEILAQMRQDGRFNHTRVMLATADAGMAQTLEEESDLVLLKPISPKQLRKLAQRLRKDIDQKDDPAAAQRGR